MKTNFTVIILSAAALLSACNELSIEIPVEVSEPEVSGAPVFSVSIAEEPDTKVGATQVGDVYKLHWEDGDLVAVRSSNGTESVWSTYVAVPDPSNPAFATLTYTDGDLPLADATVYEAYYPSTLVSGGEVSLPAKQPYAGSGPGLVPMHAESSTTSLSFSSISSFLQFNISLPDPGVEILQVALRYPGGSCYIDIPESARQLGEYSMCFAVYPGEFSAEKMTLQIVEGHGEFKYLSLKQDISLQKGSVLAFDLSVAFWEQVCTGCYYFDSECYFSGYSENVVLKRNISNPNLYCLWNPELYGGGILFTLNNDNSIDVSMDNYIWKHANYGPVYVGEAYQYLAEYYSKEELGGQSYYDSQTGIYHFNLAYYVSIGYFGNGFERFIPSMNR